MDTRSFIILPMIISDYESKSDSCSVVSDSLRPMDCNWQAPLFMEFSRQKLWSGLPFLQGIFLTQGSNLGLLHCRQILYHLNHQGSPLVSICIKYMRVIGLHGATKSWTPLNEHTYPCYYAFIVLMLEV